MLQCRMESTGKTLKIAKFAKQGLRVFDLVIGVVFLIIGANMILFPSSTKWLFFAGVALRGLFSFVKYIFRKRRWDLFFALLSLTVIVFSIFNFKQLVIVLSIWTFAWGGTKITKAYKQQEKDHNKWLANMIGGVLNITLSVILFVGWFATDSFIGYTSLVTGITFVVLGATSIMAALSWDFLRRWKKGEPTN